LTKILQLAKILPTTVVGVPLLMGGPLKPTAVAGPHEGEPIKPANEKTI